MDSLLKILSVTVGSTRNGKQYFDVACSDGVERRCWNAGLAQKINSFANVSGQGPDVTLRYDVTQNGEYTNTSIKNVFGPGEMVTPETQGGGGNRGGFSGGGGRGGGYTPEVTARITKLASFEYATTLVGGLLAGAGPEAFEEAFGLVEEAAKRIYKAARSHESGGTTTTGQAANMMPQGAAAAAPAQIPPVATNPQGVADFANGQMAGAVQVGAAVAQDAAAEAPDTVDWD